MRLPAHTDISQETLAAVAGHHGLPHDSITRLPDTGIFNAIYGLGSDFILRVPRRHPLHYRALYNESIAVPLARAAGVRTPALVVYDDSTTLLPVPYTIYERVAGDTLSDLDLEPNEVPNVWRELGSDLSRLHGGVEREGSASGLAERETIPDPRELAEDLATGGWATSSEARWLTRWLDRIQPEGLTPARPRLLHGDTQATNVMVHEGTRKYVAVLDWGSAGWGDAAWDFAGIPLRAVPFMVEGYRDDAAVYADENLEARILWRHLQLALYTARRDPQPDHSWAERPLSMLLEVTRFFLEAPDGPWRDLRPG